MAEIIVIGHGGYADGIRTNLEMVVGVPENLLFLNFALGQERTELEDNLDKMLEQMKDEEVLFCCDLPGATPFQVSAIRTAANPEKYQTVVGINQMAYMEMAMEGTGTAKDLAFRAVETTKESVMQFP